MPSLTKCTDEELIEEFTERCLETPEFGVDMNAAYEDFRCGRMTDKDKFLSDLFWNAIGRSA